MPLEITEKIKILNKDINLLKNNIDWDRSNAELKSLIKISETDGFWDNPKNAQNIMKEIKLKENIINLINKINQDYLDLKALIELAERENDNNLIKELMPRYNVIFRDDKSYPYLMMTSHAFPMLKFHRGVQKKGNKYFGPFPNSNAVRESIQLLQKVFLLRNCDDSTFNNRVRPCLQHQIKRCTAPCVKLIDEKSYTEDCRQAELFLLGKDNEVVEQMTEHMNIAAENEEYERAAVFRDRIQSLRQVRLKQFVSDFSENERPINNLKYSNITQCRFPGYHDFGGDYTHSTTHWKILTFQLLFAFIFHWMVTASTRVISWIIPDQPRSVSLSIRRQEYMTRKAIQKSNVKMRDINVFLSDDEEENDDRSEEV